MVLLGTVGLLGFLGLSCGLYFAHALDRKLHRTDAFGDVTGGRPPKLVDGAVNILILGSDKRAPGQDPGVDGERSDSIMLLHLNRGHDKAYLVSIPRDSWVYIPKSKKTDSGGTYSKINAAYAWGGPSGAIETVEKLTNVQIDHIVKVNFDGFKDMTNALGGVDVNVESTVADPRSKRTFNAGWNHLDGDAALDYVRQRYGLPNGDFDRVHRQQIFLRALMKKATDSGTLTNPNKLKKFLDATADSMTVDNDFSLTDMALQFRKIKMSNVKFLTMPTAGSDMRGDQSVVIPDKKKDRTLFKAMAHDDMDGWLEANPPGDATAGR